MAENTRSRHVLRQSISGTVPPLPSVGRSRLRLALGSVFSRDNVLRARIYSTQNPGRSGTTAQHDDLGQGDVIVIDQWRIRIATITRTRLELDVEVNGALRTDVS